MFELARLLEMDGRAYRFHKGALEALISYTPWLPKDACIMERKYCILNGIKRRPCCIHCGRGFCNWYKGGFYAKLCSSKCSREHAKTSQEYKQNIREKNKASDPATKEKRKQTMLKKYGTDTNLRFYPNNGVSPNLPKHIDPKLLEIEHLVKLNESGMTGVQIAEMIGVASTSIYYKFHSNGIEMKSHFNRSKDEDRVCAWLDSIGAEYVRRYRPKNFHNREIDIFFPDLKIGVEVNGAYWHSTKRRSGVFQHYRKFLMAKTIGIHLIQLWDYEILKCWGYVEWVLRNALNGCCYSRPDGVSDLMISDGAEFSGEDLEFSPPKAIYFDGRANCVPFEERRIVCYDCGSLSIKRQT